jgi:alpha-mannosidase
MNPIYTGKDVSYIDTKQANRAAENAVLEAERFAVFAGLLSGATYPEAALTKAWVQLAYGAHHDAITGSESDQVYLDLLTGWRDAWQLGTDTRDTALRLLSTAVDGSVVVWNPLAHNRTDIVTMHLEVPYQGAVIDADGEPVPVLSEHDGHSISWLARDVPSLGWRSFRFVAGDAPAGWEQLPGDGIGNEYYQLRVDADRGGGVSSLTVDGREQIADGRVGNELAVYDEYSAHPKAGEGPWHLLPKGPVTTSAGARATSMQRYRSALGERIVVTGRIKNMLTYTQTLVLWHGVDRVDCRTTIEGFTGEDRLLRLRWPCPVPGAMPVSEVGDAVIGRGFGLTHDRGSAKAVDAAKFPSTLDNPAHGWFGLSSMVRVRFSGGQERSDPGIGSGGGVRAIAVAEVVSPGGETDPLVRDLMVALARAGVTATCSTATSARYGDLTVDSNLPDVRISVGGPDVNAFSAAALDGADVAERTGVPAARPLKDVWVPGADLRGVHALPVLIVGVDAIAALVEDLADAEIVVDQEPPADLEDFEPRTVAVFNRGVPSFAVDGDGTLHTSLMRSCTGWPSGTWIDPPRRTAPDGSNFQLQHWTHTFDYAVACGGGDWRDADIPSRSAEFNQPLLVVAADHDPDAGGLPSWGALLEVEPARGVALGALKVIGNPIAGGSGRHVDANDGIALRLVETHGRTHELVIRSGLRTVTAPQRLNLLEQPLEDQSGGLTLHGYEIATFGVQLNLPRVLESTGITLAPDAEPAQPLYARYWLHNRGPAPLGGLPAVAHLHPHQLAVDPDSAVQLQLTAVSDVTDVALHGKVRIICPPGWTVAMGELPFMLPPGEFLESIVDVTMPSGTAPGLYPLRAELGVTGSAIPSSWRQVVEDVCVVAVGATDDRVLRLISDPEPVDLRAGETATLSVTVGTDAYADLAVEAHLISPWGTWEWMGPNIIGADLPARGTVELEFTVAPPAWVEPGEWWALIRVGCAGDLVYSPAVKVVVR